MSSNSPTPPCFFILVSPIVQDINQYFVTILKYMTWAINKRKGFILKAHSMGGSQFNINGPCWFKVWF